MLCPPTGDAQKKKKSKELLMLSPGFPASNTCVAQRLLCHTYSNLFEHSLRPGAVYKVLKNLLPM